MGSCHSESRAESETLGKDSDLLSGLEKQELELKTSRDKGVLVNTRRFGPHGTTPTKQQ